MAFVLLNLFAIVTVISSLGALLAGAAADTKLTHAERTIGGTVVLSLLLMGGVAQMAALAIT